MEMHEGAHGRRFRIGTELPRPLRPRSGAACEGGQALVEFALVLPLILLIFLGILDFGRAMNYYNDLTQLAAEGARSASVNHNPDGTVPTSPLTQLIQQQIKDQATTAEIKNNPSFHVCVGVPSGSPGVIDSTKVPATVGAPVMVTASMPFDLIPFIGDKIGIGTITLSGKTTMRAEALPTYSAGCL
jgi:Flp pilus assembly protein TadG